MAIANETMGTESIGLIAGGIWRYLSEQGPQPITKLVKDIEAPRDMVMQAIGWLAREDKIAIEEVSRRKIISLR